MKTQYYTASSLDGYIADENHSLDWLMQFDPGESSYPRFIRNVGAVAMGSGTYEWLLRNHVHPESDEPKPWPYDLPTWIFTSRSLPKAEGGDLRFVSGEVEPVHREMAEAANGKNIWLTGGGDLVGQFYDAGLLDEIIIQVTAVTLGGGSPVLPRRITDPPLQLQSLQRFGEAFVELRYEVPKR